MDKRAVLHIPQSEQAFAVSPNESVVRLRTARGDLAKAELALKYKYDEKPITTLPMQKRFSDTLFDYYEVNVPTGRGRRVYHFVLTDSAGDVYYYTENGLQTPAEAGEAYFPHFQIPFVSNSDVHTVPQKFKNAIIYQIFPDRFFTHNPKLDWKKDPKPFDFFGGDLWGAAEKLEYIKALGVNTVYLTPINPSKSNHHYDVEDYYRVADELGGDAAFREFVAKAHRLGMNVMLDGVFNHCSFFNPIFQDVVKNGKRSKYYDWFMIDGDKPDFKKCNYETFARKVAYMPKLNCDDPDVCDFVKDVAVYWIKQFGIDAWRLDVADDVAPALWREVRRAVKAVSPDAIMIGEDWMDPRAFLRGDVFDGVMNYGFTRAMRDYLAYRRIDAEVAAERLVRTYLRTSAPASKMMMNLIGSHDTHRFFSLCDEKLFFMQAALCVMFFFDGMPTVYYGDEIPLNGLADPDCRRGFDWSRTGTPTAELISSLAKMRAAESGDEIMDICAEGGALVIRRRGRTTDVLAVNASDSPATCELGKLEPRSLTFVAGGKTVEVRE